MPLLHLHSHSTHNKMPEGMYHYASLFVRFGICFLICILLSSNVVIELWYVMICHDMSMFPCLFYFSICLPTGSPRFRWEKYHETCPPFLGDPWGHHFTTAMKHVQWSPKGYHLRWYIYITYLSTGRIYVHITYHHISSKEVFFSVMIMWWKRNFCGTDDDILGISRDHRGDFFDTTYPYPEVLAP